MAERAWIWPARVAVAAVLLAAIAALSNLPYGRTPDTALLKLAWRTVGEQVPVCRTRGEAELSRLAPHMRQAEKCRVHTLPYRLVVRVDGTGRIDRPVLSAGAQGDRPLYVQEELVLSAGTHRLEIEFSASPELTRTASGIPVDSEPQRSAVRAALERAARFRADLSIEAAPGRIVLVELDQDRARFRVSGG